jgi:copper oxidase (laccase) domain-containing protein
VAAAAGNDPRWITPGKTELGVSKYLFDLSGYAEADLLRAGLSPERIFASGLCTRCRQDLFFSHRGGETVKRMAAFIGLQGGLA